MGLACDSNPKLGSFSDFGGRMCEDNREEWDVQHLSGMQAKIINLGLKIADGLKSLDNLEGRGYLSAGGGACVLFGAN